MQASLRNVAKGHGDNEDVHFEDTLRGSDWGADQRVVRMFVHTAPKAVRELAAWGVPWSRVRRGDRQVIINGQPAGNVITAAMIGQTFMTTISHPPSGQSCMTRFMVVDKQAPLADCPVDVILPSNADLDAYAGMTEADVDDCSPVTIYRDDVPVYVGNC